MTTDMSNLVSLIANTDAEYLQKSLLRILRSSALSDQATLLRLFKPIVAVAVEELHCVRCHQTYFEHRNDDDACKIKHNEPDDDNWERVMTGYEELFQRLGCCGKKVSDDWYHDLKTDFCIQARHTTDVSVVDYYPSDEGDDEYPEEGKNENVVFCGSDCPAIVDTESEEESDTMDE